MGRQYRLNAEIERRLDKVVPGNTNMAIRILLDHYFEISPFIMEKVKKDIKESSKQLSEGQLTEVKGLISAALWDLKNG